MLANEPALVQALSGWQPDCVLPVLATDLQRGWFLMPDAGVRLRPIFRADCNPDHWYRILPRYAELQLALAAHVDEILALGSLDRRLARLPSLFENLLEDKGALLIDLPDGLTSSQYRGLRQLTPRVKTMCQELADYGLPETIDHSDFHDGNIFVCDSRYVFVDWGDTCTGHPFFSMLVTLRSVADSLHLADDDPAIIRLRDVYLQPWTSVASRKQLLEAFDLAQRLGMLSRALTWQRVMSAVTGAERERYAAYLPSWLMEFLSVMEVD